MSDQIIVGLNTAIVICNDQVIGIGDQVIGIFQARGVSGTVTGPA